MVETKNTIDVRLGIKIKFWLQHWICNNKIFITRSHLTILNKLFYSYF
jgi:hypothetical protein